MVPSRVVGAAILSLLVALPAAADPVVMDTLGVFDTQVKAYTTSERPPTWVPELKVVVAIEGYANEDVLVYQLKQGAKKIGAAHTCSTSTSYADKAAPGTIPGLTKEVDLVYFDCKPDEKQGIRKGGDYQVELSLKQPLSGKEFKAFATLHFNVIVAKQGNHNDPWDHFVHNGDHNLNVSMVYEAVLPREYGPSDAGRMLSGVLSRASGKVGQPDIPAHLMIRTWFKEGETAMARTTMSCMYNGKKVDSDDGDYQTESRDYYTFVKKGKDTRFTERWIQRMYTLAKLKFDPPCGWETYKKKNLPMDQFWLSKNPGDYRCVIMSGGEIVKEILFTAKNGKIVQSACQPKINTLRHVTLVPSKDTKVSNIKFDKKAGAIGFHRVKWDTGCPPAK